MDETVLRAVERAIGTMRANLAEPLTLDDLARSAMFSKYHFSRIFQEATGVSPGRFLSAVRLAEAKRLLRVTEQTVADISYRVGYNSVGTFSTRFRLRVGVAPIEYRLRGRVRLPMFVGARGETDDAAGPTGVTELRGHVRPADGMAERPVFVGLFPSRIPEGRPVRYAVLRSPDAYALPDVPAGQWYLLAHTMPAPPGRLAEAGGYVGSAGPIRIEPGVTAQLADVVLRRPRPLDPPVLMALPELYAAPARRAAV